MAGCYDAISSTILIVLCQVVYGLDMASILLYYDLLYSLLSPTPLLSCSELCSYIDIPCSALLSYAVISVFLDMLCCAKLHCAEVCYASCAVISVFPTMICSAELCSYICIPNYDMLC